MNIKTLLLVLLVYLLLPKGGVAQSLFNEQIRKIPYDKRSVYFDGGVFHNGVPSQKTSAVTGLRHHYSPELGRERLVFDFTTGGLPRLYAYFSPKADKLYLYFFKTQIRQETLFGGDSTFIRAVNFFLVDEDNVSVEISFKHNIGLELFYLDSHGRLVADIKA